jgi:membrane protease YdiL (CAAX protease family)
MSEHVLPSAQLPDVNATQPDTVPWRWWDIAHTVALLVVGTLFIFLVYTITLIIQMGRGIAIDDSIASEAIEVGFYAVWLLAIYWCSVRRYGINWAALGVRRVAWWWLVASLLCLIGMSIAIGGIQAATSAIQGHPFVNPQIQIRTHGQPLTPVDLVLLLLSVGVAAPLVEELFFRGMLYPLMRRSTAAWVAVILNAGIFALAHGIPIMLPTFVIAGVVFTLVRERTNSLLPGMLIHMLQNTLAVLSIYAASHGNTL